MDDMLSSILNDPEKLQSAISMASSMLGGGAAEAAPAAGDAPPMGAPASAANGSAYDPSAELMQRAMPVIAEIAKSGQNAISREKLNLLNAVKPFVADSVGTQIDHGLRLVSIARMANAAMKQLGTAPQQEGDVHV